MAMTTNELQDLIQAGSKCLLEAHEELSKLPPSLSAWRDATLEAPLDQVRVLVWTDYGVEIGYYLHGQSLSKGTALPSPSPYACWGLQHSEGPRSIRWWMFLPGAPR